MSVLNAVRQWLFEVDIVDAKAHYSHRDHMLTLHVRPCDVAKSKEILEARLPATYGRIVLGDYEP